MSTEMTAVANAGHTPAAQPAERAMRARGAYPAWQRATMIAPPLLMSCLLLFHPGREVPRAE